MKVKSSPCIGFQLKLTLMHVGAPLHLDVPLAPGNRYITQSLFPQSPIPIKRNPASKVVSQKIVN